MSKQALLETSVSAQPLLLPKSLENTTPLHRRCIVHVVQHLQPGGIECLVLAIQRAANHNEHVVIISLEGEKEQLLEQWAVLNDFSDDIYCLNKKAGLQLTIVLQLQRLLHRLGAHVVHTHHIGPLVYVGLLSRFNKPRQHIHTEHDAWHLQQKKSRLLEASLLRWCNPILVADAHAVAEALMIHTKVVNVNVIYNGIDTNFFVPGDKLNARKKLPGWASLFDVIPPQQLTLIGTAGRLQEVKGHCFLIEAMLTINKCCHLLIAGDGPQRDELEQQAQRLGLHERVHFLGHVSNMPSFYQALDVFCLPSLNEGFPLAPLEAQACNVPVVLSDVGACSEAICLQSGVLVDAGDVTALSDALYRVSMQPKNKIKPRDFVLKGKSLIAMMEGYRTLVDRRKIPQTADLSASSIERNV